MTLTTCQQAHRKAPCDDWSNHGPLQEELQHVQVFASSIVGQNRKLCDLKAFRTDGEKPLFSAFQQEFKSAIHLTCFNHVRRNIKDKLHDLGIEKAIQAEISDDIFGRRVGSTLLTGLVDSSSSDIYEEKLECLLTKWRNAILLTAQTSWSINSAHGLL